MGRLFKQQMQQNRPVLKFESVTYKKAHYKNYVLDEHTKIKNRLIEQERSRSQDNMDKERRKVEEELEQIRTVKGPASQDLYDFQEERRKVLQDVCLHIVYCYLKRQDKNKAEWKRSINCGEMAQRPLCTPDNFQFIRKSFPEVLCLTEDEIPWKDKSGSDIYENSRSPHDLKCLSTRAKPIGVLTGTYPVYHPVNVRTWQPSESWCGSSDTASSEYEVPRSFMSLPPSLSSKKRGKAKEAGAPRASTSEKTMLKLPAICIEQNHSAVQEEGVGERINLLSSEIALSKFKELSNQVRLVLKEYGKQGSLPKKGSSEKSPVTESASEKHLHSKKGSTLDKAVKSESMMGKQPAAK